MYVAIFALYMKVVRVKRARTTVVEYGTTLLFVLCTATVIVEDVMYFFMLVCGTVLLVLYLPLHLTSPRRDELRTLHGFQR